MNFSELLREALRSSGVDLADKDIESLGRAVTELLSAWIEIHDPDDEGVDPQDPQRLLVLQLLEELEDKSPIPVVD